MTTAVMMSVPVAPMTTGMVSASASLRYGLRASRGPGLFMAVSRVSLEASRSGRHGNQAVIAGGRIIIFFVLLFSDVPLLVVEVTWLASEAVE